MKYIGQTTMGPTGRHCQHTPTPSILHIQRANRKYHEITQTWWPAMLTCPIWNLSCCLNKCWGLISCAAGSFWLRPALPRIMISAFCLASNLSSFIVFIFTCLMLWMRCTVVGCVRCRPFYIPSMAELCRMMQHSCRAWQHRLCILIHVLAIFGLQKRVRSGSNVGTGHLQCCPSEKQHQKHEKLSSTPSLREPCWIAPRHSMWAMQGKQPWHIPQSQPPWSLFLSVSFSVSVWACGPVGFSSSVCRMHILMGVRHGFNLKVWWPLLSKNRAAMLYMSWVYQ